MAKIGKQPSRRIQKIWDVEVFALKAIMEIIRGLPEQKMKRKVARLVDKWTKWDAEYERLHKKT